MEPTYPPPSGGQHSTAPASTQQAYPGRAAWRTAVQAAIATLLTLGGVLPLVAEVVADGLGEYLPEGWVAWLFGAAALVSAIAATVARVLAIPAVDAALRRLGLSSSPDV